MKTSIVNKLRLYSNVFALTNKNKVLKETALTYSSLNGLAGKIS